MSNELISANSPNFNSLHIDANCSLSIRVNEIIGQPTIRVAASNPDLINIEQEYSGEKLTVRAKAENKFNKGGNPNFMNNIRDAISKDSITGLLGAVVAGFGQGIHDNNLEVTVTLNIPKGFSSLEIDATNANVEIKHSSIATIDVNSSNLDFKSTSDMGVKLLSIKADNADIDFVAGGDLTFAKIEGSNCDIKIRRLSTYKGLIKVKGRNATIFGNMSGDISLGKISLKVDNGNISVV
jgi:hypothetical protein